MRHRHHAHHHHGWEHYRERTIHAMGPAGWYLRRSLRRRIFFLLVGSIMFTALIMMSVFHFLSSTGHAGVANAFGRGRALGIFVFSVLLWHASGRLAWRLARPYTELARVAKEIGAGKLSSRFELPWRRRGGDEVRILADSINDMATRIEKQMADQRELLAGVSHEIRTPLARIRLLAELLRSDTGNNVGASMTDASRAKALDDLDREVIEIDALVSELLASSRLDFAALNVHALDAADVAARALERAGLDVALLRVETPSTKFQADATLIARALANLLENAKAHGDGVHALEVRATEDGVVFAVEDRGPGFAPGDEAKVFDSFYRGTSTRNGGALGLGLSLVKRIAIAHGGSAFAENREGGGARVGITMPRASAPEESPA